ncbi:MAG: site-2 protease family protein [Acidobacteria bacterium]|nr:site-2 protease family protein [Acidobacteriota bacterium]
MSRRSRTAPRALLRVLGVEIVVHPSWLASFALVAFLAHRELAPGLASGAAARWAVAALFPLAFAASVLAHEMSHAVVARAHRLEAKRITLFVFGGVAAIGGEAPRPAAEYRIAVAGPLSSLLIAGALVGISRAVGSPGVAEALAFLGLVNLALAVFNLVPGFPLDGGRILRSALWARTRDRARATRLAAAGGKAVAFGLVGAGAALVVVSGGDEALPAFWWALLGWFLYGANGSAARAEGGDAPDPGPRARRARGAIVASHEGDAPEPDAGRGG